MTKFNWDDFTAALARETEIYRQERADMFKRGWKHPIDRKVMIELLVAEGVRWAGWYRQATLQAKYGEVFGACLRSGFGPQRHVLYGKKR
jgi:hypothetical protein